MDLIYYFTTYPVLFIILVVELIILFGLTVAMIVIRAMEYYRSKWEPYYKQSISLILLEALEKSSKAPIEESLKPFANQQMLLYQTEAFDRRFSGGDWEEIKSTIARQFLLPRARRYYKSLSWIKRNYAARSFALEPFPRDENKILTLIDDRVFLVSAIAASGAITLEIEEGIRKIINHMSKHEGYSHYFYRDLLINKGTLLVFSWIEQIADSETDLATHLSCLTVLAGKSMIITKPFLAQDLKSENETLRLAAIKVYAHNLQKESASVLSECIKDNNPLIRTEAAIGLSHFLSEETLQQLEIALSDPVWSVRLQAGLSLKRMGKLGLSILNQQTLEGSKRAFDTAHYVTNFDW